MTDPRAAFEAWAAEDRGGNITRHAQNNDRYASATVQGWWLSWQAAIKHEREQSCKLADALMELLNDTQHLKHPSCEIGYCPVRDARQALENFQARVDG